MEVLVQKAVQERDGSIKLKTASLGGGRRAGDGGPCNSQWHKESRTE